MTIFVKKFRKFVDTKIKKVFYNRQWSFWCGQCCYINDPHNLPNFKFWFSVFAWMLFNRIICANLWTLAKQHYCFPSLHKWTFKMTFFIGILWILEIVWGPCWVLREMFWLLMYVQMEHYIVFLKGQFHANFFRHELIWNRMCLDESTNWWCNEIVSNIVIYFWPLWLDQSLTFGSLLLWRQLCN